MATEDAYDARFDDEPSGETPFTAEGEIPATDADGVTRSVWFRLEGRVTWSVNRGEEEEWWIAICDGDSGVDLLNTTSKKSAEPVPGWLQPVVDYALANREDGDFEEWVD